MVDEATRSGRHMVICGDNPLAYRLAVELVDQTGGALTVIVESATRNHAPRIGELPGVRLVEATELGVDAFRAAGVAEARALALVAQDDVGNIHAALRAQEVNPDIRLVIRFFNMSLGYRIRELFPGSAVLSDSATAAPLFVAAALGEVAPSHARLPGRPGRTAYVARRTDVPAERVICGLADPDGHRLPGDDKADLVLVLAEGAAPSQPAVRRRARWRPRVLWPKLRAVASRKMALATVGLLALLGLGTALFADVAGYSWPDAVYLTVLDAAGAAQPNSTMSAAEKIIQAMITITGIAFIPVLTAAVVDAIVGARLAVALGRPREVSDHVVVVGLGNVGSRVIEQLHDLGLRVIGVERDESTRGVARARRLGLPVVIGDASREDTLREAYLESSRALVAATNNDVTNLEAALHGRAMRGNLRIVLRLFDDDLAERVQRSFSIQISRSVSFLAAPAFAAAMLHHQVLATIPVGRRVLLIAEVPVTTGSALAGQRLELTELAGQARVFGLQRHGSDRLELPPPPAHLLGGGDRLVVVATRTGLSTLLARAEPPQPQRAVAGQ
ncbi:MAG TPA: NAD-binding protein [Pseudonocardia sp.]|nr:NAD-binding protein [Pseudonocardia sp.]